jgi:hypothetical protein
LSFKKGKMVMDNLYFIDNVGCDDETYGLVRIPDEYFPKFKKFIEDLNKNSTYGCKPNISVYKCSMDLFREATDEDNKSDCLYFEDKVYVTKGTTWTAISKMECVI